MIVAGAGTGGTVTGLARGLRKHNKDVKVVAADPYGSILAMPDTLNTMHANESYKVEGIGYDFVPDVLDQGAVNKWYKTDDREAFMYARRLIAEEGLLVGGSSGSAIAAMVKGVRDAGLGKDDVVVVILPDSIRSYLSKVSLSTNAVFCPGPTIECESTVRRRRLAGSQRSITPHSASNQPPLAHYHPLPSPPRLHVPLRRQIALRPGHGPHPPSQTHHHSHSQDPLCRRHRNHARERLRSAPRPSFLLPRLIKTPRRPRHPGQPPLLDQPGARHPTIPRLRRHVLLLPHQRSRHRSARCGTHCAAAAARREAPQRTITTVIISADERRGR